MNRTIVNRTMKKALMITVFWLMLAALWACAPAAAPTPAPTKAPAAAPAPAATPTAAAPAPVATPTTGAAPTKPPAPPKGGDYTFGVLAPLTGPAGPIGALFTNGLNLAVDEINAKGGAAGMQLKANVQDHKGTAAGGTEGMNQLVNIAKVPYVISSFSSVTLAAQPMAAQNKILLINAGGTDVSLLNKVYLYSNQVMADSLVPPMAKFFWDEGRRNAALITSNDPYGDGTRKVFRDSWQKLGGKVVGDELFDVAATDFTAQLTKIKAGNPDILLVVAVAETQGRIIQQARALGITARIGGPLGVDDAIRVAKEAAEGFVDDGIAVDPQTTDPKAKAFLEAFKAKYGNYPDWPSGTMYEATYLLKDLIERVVSQGGDPRQGEALLKALQAKPEFQNYLAGGTVKFLDNQSVLRKLAFREVKNGKFQLLKLVDP